MYKIYRRNNYLIIDDGVSTPKGYLAKDVLIQEIINDSVYEIFGIIPRFGNFTNQLLHNVSIPDILKEDGSPYTPTEWVDFYTANTGFFFEITNGGGTSGIIPENQFVDNYSSLPNPTTTLHQIWVCQNSEGIQWLSGSLGGTYYPEGVYISDGTKWIYHKDNYQATQSEVNVGTNTDTFVTPKTLKDSIQWNTKRDLYTWEYLVANWSVEPALNTAISGGDVYDYTLNGTTRYRFIPTTYNPTQDAFYESFTSGTLSGLITTRG